MKKKELSVLIAASLATTLVINTAQVAHAEELINIVSNEVIEYSTDISTQTEKSSDAIYLSDIEYDTTQSSAGYGDITKDTNINGGTIKLIVDGSAVEFEKGMAAHATSTIVYDVSKYKDTYSRFISYVGIDQSQGGYGNGVKFSIYTSVDGTNWTLTKNIGLLTSDGECAYVDINIQNINYIKLYADDNGSNGNDHAVYGDAKLVTDSYGGTAISSDILKEVFEYDEILRNYSVDENLASNELTILRRDFVNKIGYDSIKRLSTKSELYKEAIEYLMTDEDALRYYVAGGDVNATGSYTATIKYFADIYEKYSAEIKSGSDDNFYLRLALSISLAYAKEDLTIFWVNSDKDRDSVARYEAYKELISSGRMDEGGNTSGGGKWSSAQFKALPITMMRWVVDNRINDDEILWLADYALSEKASGYDYLDAYNYIEYTDEYEYDRDSLYDAANYDEYNAKYNLDGYISDYGTRNVYRLWMIFEEGSVCGGLAKTYSNLADTFGRPSSVVGQPGHAATITYEWNSENKRYEWIIQNDISGWTESGNEYYDRMLGWGDDSWSKWESASYVILATDAVSDYSNYVKAVELNILAEAYSDNESKKEAYLKALEYQEINVDSMEGLINAYKADSSLSSTDYFELGKRIISTYTYYPQAMEELLALIKDNVTEGSDLVELEILENNALLRASNATAAESSCVTATKQLAEYYLGNVSTELASFSFDGENAGKIVINSKYESSKIRIKYSLDGGTTWTDTDEHVITLTSKQIEAINVTDDIQIGLVGGTDIFTIDILESKDITDSTVYKNDYENLLIGETENLEYSLDNGSTWSDYVSDLEDGTRITGDTTIKVRYKANGHYLAGEVKEYTFQEDTNTDIRSYLQLKNVTLVDSASEQNDTTHAAANLIDGNYNSQWHTRFNYTEPDKFYTVEFDEVRFITSLEYTSSGANGRIKSAEIYTSFDGVNWTKSGSVTNLANNDSIKSIDLDQSTACKYLKLVATETYGNSSGEANMYLSGKMLNFFEDTTKTYNVDATIEYSTTDLTNGDVTANVVLPTGCTIQGEASYVFTYNGSFTFEYVDYNNILHTVEAKVDWIDKEAPTADVVYDIDSSTSGAVTATLTNLSEEVTYLNGTSYTFDENGQYTFEFIDKAGNKGSVIAIVSWINKDEITDTENPGDTPSDTEKPKDEPTDTENPSDTPSDTEQPKDEPTDTEKPEDTPSDSEQPKDEPVDTEKPEDTPSDSEQPKDEPTDTEKPEDTPSDSEQPKDEQTDTDKTENTSSGSEEPANDSNNNEQLEDDSYDDELQEDSTSDIELEEEDSTYIEIVEDNSSNTIISDNNTSYNELPQGSTNNTYEEVVTIEDTTKDKEETISDKEEAEDNIEIITDSSESTFEESMEVESVTSSNEETKKNKSAVPAILVLGGAMLLGASWGVRKAAHRKKKK